MAGGRLFRGEGRPTTAAIEGQSAGLGRFGSKPGGRSDRPVSMMWWPAEWSFDGWVSDRTSDQRSLRRGEPAGDARRSKAGRPGGDRPEFAPDGLGGVGLGVEALVLGEAAGEEEEEDGARRAGGPGGPGRAEGVEVVHPQPEQPDRAGLEGEPTVQDRMHREMATAWAWCKSSFVPPIRRIVPPSEATPQGVSSRDLRDPENAGPRNYDGKPGDGSGGRGRRGCLTPRRGRFGRVDVQPRVGEIHQRER